MSQDSKNGSDSYGSQDSELNHSRDTEITKQYTSMFIWHVEILLWYVIEVYLWQPIT